MLKFRCQRQIEHAEGDQEFEVEADDLDHAIELFKSGDGELVETNCEITALSEYDLENVWEE
jgi:hypothetical protein